MNKHTFRISAVALAMLLSVSWLSGADEPTMGLRLTPKQTLETHGLSVFLFHNFILLRTSPYVSGIGGQSKLIAYYNNRADYTFIPDGVIPGVTIIQPDFPELMNDWPFLWYENEYVVDTASAFTLAANAANALGTEHIKRRP